MRILLPVLTLLIVGDLSARTQDFVPGEVMLKFVTGSSSDDAVSRAGQASPPNLAAIEPTIGELQANVQLPLRATQISSGNWLVLSVDFQALADRSAQRLRDQENVTSVQARASEAGEPGGVARSVEILVKFALDSPEDKAVASALESGAVEPLAGLLSAMEQSLGLPLKGMPSEEGLTLRVELKALTLRLVEDLKTIPEIESAQPNFILSPFRPG